VTELARTILITEAAKGTGRATADCLATAGHYVVGIARPSTPDFSGEVIELDLADAGATHEALAAVLDLKSRIAVQTVQAAPCSRQPSRPKAPMAS
jgi:NAD(P)-dependent dehydrogenase (short-subunit alcohol dehydrogenase family)